MEGSILYYNHIFHIQLLIIILYYMLITLYLHFLGFKIYNNFLFYHRNNLYNQGTM